MRHLKSDGLHLLQGLTFTFLILAAITTIASFSLVLILRLVSSNLTQLLRELWGRAPEGDIMVAAFVQAVIWLILPRTGFISERTGRQMMSLMSGITLLTFVVVLFLLH